MFSIHALQPALCGAFGVISCSNIECALHPSTNSSAAPEVTARGVTDGSVVLTYFEVVDDAIKGPEVRDTPVRDAILEAEAIPVADYAIAIDRFERVEDTTLIEAIDYIGLDEEEIIEPWSVDSREI